VATFTYQELLDFAERVLSNLGVPADDAGLTAGLLARADLQGYSTHGVGVLPDYVQRIQAGIVHLDARPTIARDGKATAVIDGQLYLGQVVATQAMDLAIAKAHVHGLGSVAVRNSAHVGRLADYVERAAEAGMIGIGFVSVGGNGVGSFGSMEPTGNSNTVGFGIPGRDGQHVLLDFTTASMSMREIARRGSTGQPIPPGVALDNQGSSATDYPAFAGPPRGVVLPFGGHKGAGLHLVAEILGGVLSGHGRALDWLPRGGPAINGALFEAIDVAEYMPLDEFVAHVDELAEFLRTRKPAPGNPAVRLPGDGARGRAAQRLAEGIPLEDVTVAALRGLATQLGVPPLA
jgi:uncharacterized oxidoreductase